MSVVQVTMGMLAINAMQSAAPNSFFGSSLNQYKVGSSSRLLCECLSMSFGFNCHFSQAGAVTAIISESVGFAFGNLSLDSPCFPVNPIK